MIPSNTFSSRRRATGFTLIELMITCAILAIIVGIAVPAYTYEVRKSRRTEGRNAVLDLASREERYLSVAGGYSQVPTDMGYAGAAWGSTDATSNGYYQMSVQVPAPTYPVGSQTFLITAIAINQQAGDTACGSFTLNHLGQQIAYTSAAVVNTSVCWGN